MGELNADLTLARQRCEDWQSVSDSEFPYLELDKLCRSCMYTCHTVWRFQGMTGASGQSYTVGPMCPVLWCFHPANPLARTHSHSADL